MTVAGKKVPPEAPAPFIAEPTPLIGAQFPAATELMVIPVEASVAVRTATEGSPDTLVHPDTEAAAAVKLKLAVTWAFRRGMTDRLVSNTMTAALLIKIICLLYFSLESIGTDNRNLSQHKRMPCR